jgi:16S rRNA (uracil1498-N3)-methyltransferase
MIRIFAQWQDRVILSEDSHHHLVNVLRIKPREMIELVIDSSIYLAKVHQVKPLIIERLEKIESNHELPFLLTLIYPISKGERFDWVVQKATELGVHELIPCSSERTVVVWQPEDLPKKFQRYQRMIDEATLQSKREKRMRMERYLNLSEALTLSFDHQWIASEYHLQDSKSKASINAIAHGKHVAMVVGPEGGFSEKEIQFAINQGFQPISLGPSILRTETAVTVALSMIRDRGINHAK